MFWRKSFTLLLRLLLIAAFVPVLVYMILVLPALAAQVISGTGLAPSAAVIVAGPAVVGFVGLVTLSWVSLRLWRVARWRWLGFALGVTACAAVWTAVLV